MTSWLHGIWLDAVCYTAVIAPVFVGGCETLQMSVLKPPGCRPKPLLVSQQQHIDVWYVRMPRVCNPLRNALCMCAVSAALSATTAGNPSVECIGNVRPQGASI
jgi:hypothetical protein